MLLPLVFCLIANARAASDAGGSLADQPFSARPFGFLIGSFSPVPPNPEDPAGENGFDLEARLGAEARLDLGKGGQMGAVIEVNLSPVPLLKDAFVIYRPARFLRLDLGQFKVPYSLGFLASDTRRLLPTTSRASTGMVGRDVGFMMTASLPVKQTTFASVQVGAFNGEGANQLENADLHYLYAVRAVITPFGARSKVFEGSNGAVYLGVGGSWLVSESRHQYAGDLQFAWNVLSLQGEFLYGKHDLLGDGGTDYGQLGGYGTLSAFIPVPWLKDHVQLVGRFGQSDPNDQVSDDPTGEVQPATREITGGLNLYWFATPGPFNDIKFQVAYSHFDELEGDSLADDKLSAAASIRF